VLVQHAGSLQFIGKSSSLVEAGTLTGSLLFALTEPATSLNLCLPEAKRCARFWGPVSGVQQLSLVNFPDHDNDRSRFTYEMVVKFMTPSSRIESAQKSLF
jgi:hypothetical protein